MNIIFNTQSIGIHIFWKLFNEIKNQHPDDVKKVGFFVTNKDEFDKFNNLTPSFVSEIGDVLSEWDILDEASKLSNVDLAYIEEWERCIGDASLWNAIVSDRRFNYSVHAQFVQDYQPSYKHEELLKILQIALQRISLHFEKVKPDAIIGLNAVTLYDYLYYLMATEKGIPFFQLKLTRVENYVSLFTNPLGISPHIGEKIAAYLKDPAKLHDNSELFYEASEFIERSRNGSLSYEGAISKKTNAEQVVSKSGGASTATRKSLVKRIKSILFNEHQDNHYPPPLMSQIYTRVIKPFRKSKVERHVFNVADTGWEVKLRGYKYALYPLNTEPEVALLVYGRSYRNQIETVRNVASSLPVGWKLVVKEHPNSMGYRSIGYYKKLQEIPNVVLLGPKVDTGRLVDEADLVFVVFGTIGLEAVMKEKPLITFCNTPYGSFPEHMVRFVNDFAELGDEVRILLDTYRYDEHALRSYVAAHIEASIRINLFTGLLGKGNRNASTEAVSIDEQYINLAKYTWDRIGEEMARIKDS